MKKRIMMSLMIIGLVSALVGGATFATWTASSNVSGNTFNTDTMSFTITGGTASGLYPGASKVVNVTVNNPEEYAITVNSASISGATWGASGVTYNTPSVANLTGALSGSPVTVNAGSTATVPVAVTLDAAAGNDYQANTATFTVTLNASAF